MIKTLREIQEELSQLVEAASRGEDVLITVDGKIKARLTKAEERLSPEEVARWVDRLQADAEAAATGTQNISTEQILDEIRADRI